MKFFKESITQEEIEKEAKEYAEKEMENASSWEWDSEYVQGLIEHAWYEGAKFTLGKQEKDGIDLKKLNDTLKKETKESLNQWLSEKDPDTVIQGWVAIDEAYNECYLHTNKPTHEVRSIADTGDYESYWRRDGQTYLLDADLFPDIDSDSEPQEVEIIIKRKKK